MGCSNSKPKESYDITQRCTAPGVIFSEEMINIDGQDRNVASWFPETYPNLPIKALCFISHGLNEHSLCYYNIALTLALKNYGVFAMDHMSHGKSSGRRGVVSDHRRLPSDFIEFITRKRAFFQNIPVFIFAHSMGTLIALKAVVTMQSQVNSEIAAIVLSGPAIFAGPAAASPFGCGCLYPLTQTSFAACLTSCMSGLDPGGPAAPLIVSEVCNNTEYLAEADRDERRNPPIVTNKTAYEILQLISAVKEAVPRLTIPVFCIHGADDQIALKTGSEFIFQKAGTDITQRKLLIVQGCKHELLHELSPKDTETIDIIVNYYEEQVEKWNNMRNMKTI